MDHAANPACTRRTRPSRVAGRGRIASARIPPFLSLHFPLPSFFFFSFFSFSYFLFLFSFLSLLPPTPRARPLLPLCSRAPPGRTAPPRSTPVGLAPSLFSLSLSFPAR